MDTVAPPEPVLVAPEDNAVVRTDTPLFEWEAPITTADLFDYVLQVTSGDIAAGPFDIEVVVSGDTTEFQVGTGDPLGDAFYGWRVIARDEALNTASSVTRIFTVLLRGVDLKLESDSDVVGFFHEFDVTIKVEPQTGQPVSTVLAFLNFNTGDLEVVSIESGSTLEAELLNAFDNDTGTIDFSATTFGKAPTGDFVLAVVTFRSVNSGGTPATTIRFSTGDTELFLRRTEATFRGSTVLRNLSPPLAVELSGLKVDIALETESTVFPSNALIPVAIAVKPNGQAVDTVQVFLNFNTGDLELVGIAPDATLEAELISTSDEIKGTIDFGAATFGIPRTGDFVLAVVTFRSREPANLNEQVTTADLNSTFLRRTEAVFKGASVRRNLEPAVFTVLKPFVDIRLGLKTGDGQTRFGDFAGFAFARDEVFRVVIRLETNGQRVSAVDALLDFDPDTLEVLSVVSTGGSRNELGIIIRFDNQAGTIDFSSVSTADATTGDLAEVTFRAREATESLNVGFHEEDPRRTEAAFQGASVLRELIGFPVEIALELKLKTFESPFDIETVIKVRPNGNRISAVDVFLDFESTVTGDLEVKSITRGKDIKPVEVLGFSTSDNVADFSASILGPARTTEFELAVVNAVLTGDLSVLEKQIKFIREFPRKPGAFFRGSTIPDDRLRLVGVVIEDALPGAPENLQPVDSIFDATFNTPTPTFRWDPAVKRPAAGIRTFSLIITGDADTTILAGDAELGRVHTKRSASKMSANEMNPRKITSSFSKRENMRRNPFNRRNSLSISLRLLYISRSYSHG